LQGTAVGNYTVTELLATGGMGEVYVARHSVIGREAVIKVLRLALSSDREMVGRFFNEARAAAEIEHPGIVGIFDVGYTDDGRAFLIMERLRGEPLSDRIARGRIDPRVAAVFVSQLCSALGAAHAAGIVHRDLKPANIFLTPDPQVPCGERVKILDFGIAKLRADHAGSVMTQAGAIFGTPAYMAPEQCADAATVDHRADLYAVGCILHEMVVGAPPFGQGGLELFAAHLEDTPPPLRSIDARVPPAFEQIVLALLAKNPAERFASCDALAKALDGSTQAPPEPEPRPAQEPRTEPRPAPRTAPKPRRAQNRAARPAKRRGGILGWVIAAFVILGAATAGALWWKQRQGDEKARSNPPDPTDTPAENAPGDPIAIVFDSTPPGASATLASADGMSTTASTPAAAKLVPGVVRHVTYEMEGHAPVTLPVDLSGDQPIRMHVDFERAIPDADILHAKRAGGNATTLCSNRKSCDAAIANHQFFSGDIYLSVDVVVPMGSNQTPSSAGPYVRGQIANKQRLAGVVASLDSEGWLEVVEFGGGSLGRARHARDRFDPARPHRIELAVRGSEVVVALDGRVLTFDGERSLTTSIDGIPGEVGVTFSALRPGASLSADQTASRVVVARWQDL
jgi:serine/threonine-protein kinase